MRRVLVAFVAIAAAPLVGCSSDEAPMKTDPSTVMNPGGSAAKLPPQAQGLAEQQAKAGEASKHNMDEMARQMKAAQAASGGK